jgi:DNA polymerase-3 subunit delta'
MSDADLPALDAVEGAPHPRETARLFGQDAAEAAFLAAHQGGRLHHGWLLTGPRGVGKATLAWRIARYLLATPDPGDAGGLFGAPPLPETLDIAPEDPVARRVAALSEPRLCLIRRTWDDDRKPPRPRAGITVDDVRRLNGFFGLSATEGGRRVVIVDAADDLNPNAANALLKLLEEPPARATLLLISHQPSGLLPTIRSRCRVLRLASLGPEDMARALNGAGVALAPADAAALAELSGGSVGEAVRLANLDGLALYAAMIALFATLPRLDRGRALALADAAGARGADAQVDLILRLFDLFLSRLARAALAPAPDEAAPGEAALLARLCPTPCHARAWADLHQALGARARHARAVNLDPAALVLDMVLQIEQTAAA